jgi:hypothetical protein
MKFIYIPTAEEQIYKSGMAFIPNIYFDEVQPVIDSYEFSVLMFFARKMFGFHKDRDRISLTQIMQGTGIKKNKAIKATHMLMKLGLIKRLIRGHHPRGKASVLSLYSITCGVKIPWDI